MATPDPNDPNVICRRRHAEWAMHAVRWRWLLDSLEGGDRYRDAIYGMDDRGLPVRNLVRHKHEYPDPYRYGPGASAPSTAGGSPVLGGMGYAGDGATTYAPGVGADPSQYSTIDDYEYRRARTPVPSFVREAIETHLSKVYAKEVRREGPAGLKAWWDDVDGAGTVVDDWMQQDVAPLLMVLGQLDLCFDHPPAKGERPATQADVIRSGLAGCVAAIILPENMLWWRLDAARRYAECLVLEYEEDTGGPRLRYWDAEGWRLFSCPDGWSPRRTAHHAKHEEVDRGEHPYGRVPIVRVFDRRKPRTRNVGQSRYEGIAEKMREFYNRDSELVLSDTTQAHPVLMAPEAFCTADAEIPIGPGFLLPMKELRDASGSVSGYEPFRILDFPKGAADSIRTNKRDIRDEIDRDAKLTKPAGAAGTQRGTVAQSGISKALDNQSGNDLLTQISAALGKVEMACAEMALTVLGNGPLRPAALDPVSVVYPTSFDLMDLAELTDAIAAYQAILGSAGDTPETDILMLMKLRNEILIGEDDETYDLSDDEIREAVQARATMKAQGREAAAVGMEAIAEGGTAAETPDPRPSGGTDEGGAAEPQYRMLGAPAS